MVTSMLVVAAYVVVPVVLALIVVRLGNVVRYIPNDNVGIMEKIWSARGSVTGGFIALGGEAGFQPEILRGGVHFFLPFTYRIHVEPLVTIPQGKIGYVFARDGLPLEPSQTLASNVEADDFRDVRGFFEAHGQKGPQRRLLREGTHALNLVQFVVLTDERLYAVALSREEEATLTAMQAALAQRSGFEPVVILGADDVIGVVTVHDGPSLPSGEIIAPEVDPTHDSFQNADRFLSVGGSRGRQLQVLVEGTWFLNRLFATVELIEKTVIEVGTVGVVVSYTGKVGTDLSGASYHHGELVKNGYRGVWNEPLLPGKYAFNTYAGKILTVPTTNFVLKWSKAVTSNSYDANLSEVSLITCDAFEPLLPLSVVLHIPYRRAPELIQRFGDPKQLVEQTLDPMVSSYFKNIGQQKTLIELLQQRDQIQAQASADMKTRFEAYTLEFQEVLIGTPRAREGDETIETILIQLRQRQIAEEQIATYAKQAKAAEQEKDLNEARATAAMQATLTESAIKIEVIGNEGAALLAKANKDAETIKVTAAARAQQIFVEGEATAKAAKLQVDAYGGPEFRLSQEIARGFFEALEKGHQPVVPQVVVGGEGAGSGGGSVGALLSGLMAASMLKLDTKLPLTNGDLR